jgi:phage tail-like protein
VEVRRRDILATISPYCFSARLDEEGDGTAPRSPERIQCAYESIPVRVESVLEEELPAGEDPEEYVYIYVNQHISKSRLYRLEATRVEDAWGNSCVGSQLDFQTPTFGHPGDRIGFWTPGVVFPRPDMEEDLEDEGQLRRMSVVLQDVLDVLWYEVDSLQNLKSPDLCKEEWLEWLLHNQGNPFRFPIETEVQRRKLAGALRPYYSLIGTPKGIIEMTYAILGIRIEIFPYVDSQAWILGDDVYGVLGETTILAASTAFAKNCYEIHSPAALTQAQVRIIREIATWADPPNMHLIKIVEDITGGATHTILDVSLFDTNVEPQE